MINLRSQIIKAAPTTQSQAAKGALPPYQRRTTVIPAQAGIYTSVQTMDPRIREDDSIRQNLEVLRYAE